MAGAHVIYSAESAFSGEKSALRARGNVDENNIIMIRTSRRLPLSRAPRTH
jgi:hypothetical protein